MTTRTEYGIRVNWGDGRAEFVPEIANTREEADYRAKSYRRCYPTCTAEVVWRKVRVTEWQALEPNRRTA